MKDGNLSIVACVHCNTLLNFNSRECGFCSNCGADLRNVKPEPVKSSERTPGGLGLFCHECGGEYVLHAGSGVCSRCGSLYPDHV